MRDKMRRIVRQGYEQGDYSAAFRRHGPPSAMERRYLDRLLVLCPPDPKILDLGCGTGLPVDKYLADRGADLTGIDISPKHVALAKGNLPSASYREGDILHAVLPEGSFDGIVSFYAIFHIPRSEHGDLFIRINRLLRLNGLFLATLGTSDLAYGEEANWAGARMAWSSCDAETYRRLLTETSFDIIESAFEGQPGDVEHHFWILARKSNPSARDARNP
jgi:SAM-dependent methyltransferase